MLVYPTVIVIKVKPMLNLPLDTHTGRSTTGLRTVVSQIVLDIVKCWINLAPSNFFTEISEYMVYYG